MFYFVTLLLLATGKFHQMLIQLPVKSTNLQIRETLSGSESFKKRHKKFSCLPISVLRIIFFVHPFFPFSFIETRKVRGKLRANDIDFICVPKIFHSNVGAQQLPSVQIRYNLRTQKKKKKKKHTHTQHI